MSNNAPTPTIYLIPVPLANTGVDRVLPQYNRDIILPLRHYIVENLRSARRFLKSVDRDIDIDTLSFSELNVHTPPEQIEQLLEPASRGFDMGIISEAGCPAVADPGADAVRIAQKKGYNVCPLVGPSSIIMGLMGSGFNGQSFAFCGYLPIDPSQRTERIRQLQTLINRHNQTQIFIETPYRNNKLIAELCRTLPGNMLLCVASDITGPRQNIKTMPLAKWATTNYNYDKIPSIFLLFK
ncbi:MAG: SAM-dependent methyltransferase [Muribaculum sp.]|nr:SAM-dependent methyltransferase [Muribaculaceae bacterium]MCM1080767.1 SAM-dependent methyltransferase [Muribaculum sp.]